MKEYCNFCWAKLPNGICFLSESGRSESCRKARERFAGQKKEAESAKNKKEIEGLRNYLAYIPKRLVYLEAINAKDSNEWTYYVELYESIKRWGKSHGAFFKYLVKRLKFEDVKDLLGVSERFAFRMIGKQRRALIDFITAQETSIREKYPFEEATIEEVD